jgi:prolyl-tRNA synthetase
MKASQFFISTLKEAPADAEVASHQLMTRAGMIKKLGAGIYSYMPMGLRVIRKVEQIVREEMNRAGAVELSMPVVQAELWQETGRFAAMGPELLRIQDRHERDYVVQPTSEEVVTDIARQEIKSYKQLPRNFYQIQTKFRDERRPRFGLMRGREFTMKDAYSFDRDLESAKASYQNMSAAYRRIFDRFGLRYRAVAADSGTIGGDMSEEFQVIAATGEDAIVYCPNSNYAANMEKAEALAPQAPRAAASQTLTRTPTPGKSTCADVAELLGLPLQRTVKSLVLATDQLDAHGVIVKTQVWLLLLRGDHDMNEVKVGKVPELDAGFRFATVPEIEAHFGCTPGYLGPIALKQAVKLVVDREVAAMHDWICGGNEIDVHLTGVNWGRDLPEPEVVADIRNVLEGDLSPDGKGVLAIERGIEVGHVFVLGTKYSKAMNATFLDVNGKPQFMEMGCYGIGITRLPAAAIEQNHDERGIIWPDAIAPFTVVLCPISPDRFPEVQAAADKLYAELIAAGVDVILDDRGERPGVMFAEWELIGVPHRITIGDRGLKAGEVEYQHRRDAAATKVATSEALNFLKSKLNP